MSDHSEHIYRRMYHMPAQLERAEKKLARLYLEAKQYRMNELLCNPSAVNAAWDREVLIAQIEAAQRGEETSMGVDGV